MNITKQIFGHLSDEQINVVKEISPYLDDYHYIPGELIHSCLAGIKAFTDEEYLIFANQSLDDAQKFIYYIGAENEAELKGYWRGIAIYGNISEVRLKYIIEKGGK